MTITEHFTDVSLSLSSLIKSVEIVKIALPIYLSLVVSSCLNRFFHTSEADDLPLPVSIQRVSYDRKKLERP